MNIEELKKENVRLKREIEIEERVTLRWKALAGVFHDTLWSALRRYDPPVYEKLRKEKKSGQPEEKKSVQSTFSRMDAGLPQGENCGQQSASAGQKKENKRSQQKEEGERLWQKEENEGLRLTEENERLRAENHKLQSALAGQSAEHKKWEQMAVCFHDTLWQVLLKYEPDTYGPLYPEHKADEEPDYSHFRSCCVGDTNNSISRNL